MSANASRSQTGVSDLTQSVFDSIDSGDVDAYTKLIAENIKGALGNFPFEGRDAVLGILRQLLESVRSIQHQVIVEWKAGPTTIAELSVTYNRLDGNAVTIPCVTIFQVNDEGLIDDYRVFLDMAPVFAS
jgi:ketosteroid isomerase-like protein